MDSALSKQCTSIYIRYIRHTGVAVSAVFPVFDRSMMASSHPTKKPRHGIRQSIQLTHASEEAKRVFSERLDKLKQALTPGSNDNLSLMSKLMARVYNKEGGCPTPV